MNYHMMNNISRINRVVLHYIGHKILFYLQNMVEVHNYLVLQILYRVQPCLKNMVENYCLEEQNCRCRSLTKNRKKEDFNAEKNCVPT